MTVTCIVLYYYISILNVINLVALLELMIMRKYKSYKLSHHCCTTLEIVLLTGLEPSMPSLSVIKEILTLILTIIQGTLSSQS